MVATTHAEPPLVVDLDGTIVRGDLLLESFVQLCRLTPTALYALPFWLLGGRAALKHRLAEASPIDPTALSYHTDVVSFVRAEHERGRRVILATAADHQSAAAVAGHLGVFDAVLSSDGVHNLKGSAKLQKLQELVGPGGFDYVGDATADIPLWRAARHSLYVGPKSARHALERSGVHFERVFDDPGSTPRHLLRALRPHQWSKNLLVLLPLLLAHVFTDVVAATSAAFAFVAFCLCASAVYVLNDILDVGCDRLHRTKKHRPFASGALPLEVGFVVSPLLLCASFVLAIATLPLPFVAWLAVYALTTTVYSLRLKRETLLDVTALAGLYIIRLVAGSAATTVPISSWLATFGLFFFVSLALAKRAAELAQSSTDERARGRGYDRRDIPIVSSLGVASGFVSVLVLALYMQSTDIAKLYVVPELLWGVLPLFLYWIGRVWILASRGELHEDPVAFALKDRGSYVVLALIVLLTWGAL